MALAAVADTRRNSEIHLCSPTFQRCLTDLRSTFRFSEKSERMFSSRFLIRKLASLVNRDAQRLTRRRRATAFESLYGGFRNPEGSFLQRSWSLFSSDQLNSLIRRNTKALQRINGSFFFQLMRVVFVKMTHCHRKFSGGNQQNQDSSGKSGIIGGFFFPFSETKNRNLTAQRQMGAPTTNSSILNKRSILWRGLQHCSAQKR